MKYLTMCLGATALLGLACQRQQSPAPPAAKPAQVEPAGAQAPAQAAAQPTSAPAPDTASDAERIRAGQWAQRLFAPSRGPLEVKQIRLVSGVFYLQLAPTAPGAAPFEVYVSRDLQLVFPQALRPQALAQGEAAAANFAQCLLGKGLRVYGDGQQRDTQRQLAEIGPGAAGLLTDCARQAGACAALGQTSLPVVQLGERKVAGVASRGALAEWSGCPLPSGP